jgi:hypothetical protein
MRLATAALLAAVLATVAAGCGGGGPNPRAVSPPETVSRPKACPLSPKLRRDIAAAKREIVRMRRLEAPLKTVHATGPLPLELAVNRFLLDVGPLPVDVKSRLMDKAKSASALCHDCFNAIEAEEPVIQTRLGRPACAGR